MKNSSPLRKRFLFALIIYTAAILFLWLGCYSTVYRASLRIAGENTLLAAENLTDQMSAEFTQMKTISSAISGSSYVQEFLEERDVSKYYEKAEIVSEIIQKAAFPITSTDSVIVINAQGDFYRFSGDLSNASCEELYKTFQGAGAVYTVVEADNTMFFCYNAPVFETSGQLPSRIGNVVMLTRLEKTRRMLSHDHPGIDMAVILDGKVILSSNPVLEGEEADELSRRYSAVSSSAVAGAPLTVAAAIQGTALFPESGVLLALFLTVLCLLLAVIAVLYRYLSSYLVLPMANIISHVRKIGGGVQERLPETGIKDFDTLVSDINNMLDRTDRYNTEMISGQQKLFDAELLKQKMRMNLLTSQMDAHFVVNTLNNIKRLSNINENDKAAEMAEGLAVILGHKHTGDDLVNVFADFEVLRKYISIMNIKFENKFSVEYDLDYDLEACLMPGMILQPIVENALHHGLQGKEQDARLVIKGTIQENGICFEFSDNGAGIPPAKLKTIRESLSETEMNDFPPPGLKGVALSNIQRRIRLRFGGMYSVTIQSDWGKGTTVTVSLPLIPDK